MATYARLQNADSIEVDNVRSVAGTAVTAPNGINTDTIAEVSAAAGVTVDGLQIKDSSVVLISTSWVPVLGTQAGTYTGTVITYAKYFKLGALCFGSVYFVGTLSLPSNYITFTLPFASANLGNTQYFAGGDFENGSPEAVGLFSIVNNTTECRAYRSILTPWSAGANRYVIGNFFYICV